MKKMSFWSEHLISIVVSLSFFVSLFCYVGYLYGLGLNPTDIPLSITDIANGILTFSPSVVLFFISLYFFQFNQDNKNPEYDESNNQQIKRGNQIPARITGVILFLLFTWCAFWGTPWWMPFLLLNVFILMINLFNPPQIFPIFWTRAFPQLKPIFHS